MIILIVMLVTTSVQKLRVNLPAKMMPDVDSVAERGNPPTIRPLILRQQQRAHAHAQHPLFLFLLCIYFGARALAKVARWQNLIPSFPWIAPGWRAIQGKEGIKFCSVA